MAGLIFVGDLDSMVLCKGCREGALHTAALHDLAPPAQAAPEGRKPTVAGSVGPGPADVVKRALREVDVIIEEQSEVVLDGGDGNRRTMPLNAITESAREGEIGPRQGREAQVCQVLTRVVDRVTAMVKSKDSSSS